MAAHLRLAPAPEDATPRRRTESPIVVVLADDHAGARRSLRQLLDGERDIEVVADTGDLPEALGHARGHPGRVLVLDLGMSNRSSIEAIRRVRAEVRDTRIIVLTMEESAAFARCAFDAGAIGVVLKHQADSELPAALRCAAQGKQYLSPRVAAAPDAPVKARPGR